MDWNLFWTAFGAIGGTLGALATFVAVIVALWQTKLNYKKKVQLSFTDNITMLFRLPMMYTLLKKVLNSLFLSSILSTGEYGGS